MIMFYFTKFNKRKMVFWMINKNKEKIIVKRKMCEGD